MTDYLVKQAREVLEDVTAGPWEIVFDRHTWNWLEVDGPSFKIGAPTRATDLSFADEIQRKKDARFIAASRQLVPAMVDRIEELEAKNDNLIDLAVEENRRAETAEWCLGERTEELEAEVARLRKVMTRMAEGWSNALELDIINEQHRASAKILRDEARTTLQYKETTDD